VSHFDWGGIRLHRQPLLKRSAFTSCRSQHTGTRIGTLTQLSLERRELDTASLCPRSLAGCGYTVVNNKDVNIGWGSRTPATTFVPTGVLSIGNV
jgi:hypothetical protein